MATTNEVRVQQLIQIFSDKTFQVASGLTKDDSMTLSWGPDSINHHIFISKEEALEIGKALVQLAEEKGA